MAEASTQSPIEFIRTRRSVLAANIKEPGPSARELDTIIDAGLRVPDHSRCGPWRLQIIGKEGQHKLGDLYADLFAQENDDATQEQIDYWRHRPATAPCLIVVTCYPNQEKIHKVPLIEQQMSVGALCQNLLNGAHALGYVGQWLTEWPSYHKDVKALLGHAPEIEIIGFMFLGTASELPKERKRIGAEEVVSHWNG